MARNICVPCMIDIMTSLSIPEIIAHTSYEYGSSEINHFLIRKYLADIDQTVTATESWNL